MKKAICKITVAASTFEEVETKIKEEIKEFLGLSDEEFAATYDRLEIDLRAEKVSAEHLHFFADATFRVPGFE